MATTGATFVRFQDDVEHADPDERRHLEEIVAIQRSMVERLGEKYRHAVRSVHTKSHGILAGTLDVSGGLEAPYAQGLFARPGRYDVVMRFSTNPGDLLPDDVSSPRGLAIKILGPMGQVMLDGHEGERTQDLLFINGPILGAHGPKEFAAQMKLLERHLEDPERRKQAVSGAARTIEKVLETFGKPSSLVTSLGGQPGTNLLGETYFTQLPSRHGDYIAKYALQPASENLKALTNRPLDLSNPDCLRDACVAFFAEQTAVWDVGVQLCTDLDAMPIEDGKTPWPQELSPFVTVARLTASPQPAYSPARRVYGDDVLSFNPWHGFAAHRPLGAHNRVRRVAYTMSSGYRHEHNARTTREPRDASEFFALEEGPAGA